MNSSTFDAMDEEMGKITDGLHELFAHFLSSSGFKEILELDHNCMLMIDSLLPSFPFEWLLSTLYGSREYSRDFSAHILYHGTRNFGNNVKAVKHYQQMEGATIADITLK